MRTAVAAGFGLTEIMSLSHLHSRIATCRHSSSSIEVTGAAIRRQLQDDSDDHDDHDGDYDDNDDGDVVICQVARCANPTAVSSKLDGVGAVSDYHSHPSLMHLTLP